MNIDDGQPSQIILYGVLALFLGIGLTILMIVSLISVWNIAFGESDLVGLGTLLTSSLSVLISGILTLALVWIYAKQTGLIREQRDISARQAEIHDQQRKIMKADYIPEVTVEVTDVAEDTVTICCNNLGTGLAKDFQVTADFFVSEDPIEDFDLGVKLSLLRKNGFSREVHIENYGEMVQTTYYSGAASISRESSDGGDFPRVQTSEIIRPEEEEEEERHLSFRLYFDRYVEPMGDPGNTQRVPFVQGIGELRERNIRVLGIRLYISYRDIFDEIVNHEILMSSWVELEHENVLGELIETSNNRSIMETQYLSDEIKYSTTYFY